MRKYDAEYISLNRRAWNLHDATMLVGHIFDAAKKDCKELSNLPVEVELERLESKNQLERIHQYLESQLDELASILKKAEI